MDTFLMIEAWHADTQLNGTLSDTTFTATTLPHLDAKQNKLGYYNSRHVAPSGGYTDGAPL